MAIPTGNKIWKHNLFLLIGLKGLKNYILTVGGRVAMPSNIYQNSKTEWVKWKVGLACMKSMVNPTLPGWKISNPKQGCIASLRPLRAEEQEDEEKHLILHCRVKELSMKLCILVPKAPLPNKNWACTHNPIRTRTKTKCPDQVCLLSSGPNFWIAEKKAIFQKLSHFTNSISQGQI